MGLKGVGKGIVITEVCFSHIYAKMPKFLLKKDKNMAKDSNGTELAGGDSVTVIKDLKVKGSSATIKRGTKVNNIRLTDSDDEVEGKVDKQGVIVLKTCFLKKI